jgi:hypothetical protein
VDVGSLFLPLIVPLLILFAIGVEIIFAGLERRVHKPAILNGLLGGLALVYMVLLPFSQPAYDNPILGTPSDKVTSALFTAAAWLQEHADAGTRAAAFQSGILAYFLNIPVINLDGVVNHDALDYFVHDNILSYVEAEDVTYLVDWRFFTGTLDFSRLTRHNAHLIITFSAK